MLPRITTTGLSRAGSTGTISATVEPGDQLVKTVWAAVYAPSFQEPVGTTLDLGVPLVQLWPSADLKRILGDLQCLRKPGRTASSSTPL
jgi:hypothetical protein